MRITTSTQPFSTLVAALAIAAPALAAAQTPVTEATSDARTTLETTLEEVRITATPLRRTVLETAQPVLALDGEELLRRRSTTIAETLADQPGITASNFGPIASRPIIRGQGGMRVQVFQDGADVLDAAALSEDHAVTLDPLLAERIEVVRGPAALLYGNAASAGAVNVVTRRIPTEPLGTLRRSAGRAPVEECKRYQDHHEQKIGHAPNVAAPEAARKRRGVGSLGLCKRRPYA